MAHVLERRLTVCVDDFGLHAGVNAAVFALVAQGRVTATSVLVDGLAWPDGAPLLREAAGQGGTRRADVGLHINFSEALQPPTLIGSAWQPRPVSRLILEAHARRLNPATLQGEIERQWRLFEAHWGQPPDFVDGHQHVHQLPQIRDALWAVIDARRDRLPPGFWVRDGGTSVLRQVRARVPVGDALKAGIIAALGSTAIRREALRRGLKVSSGLLGSYPFNRDAQGYLALWRAWLALTPPQGGLVMCHPSALPPAHPAVPDPIAAARQTELAALQSDALGVALIHAGVRISRFSS